VDVCAPIRLAGATVSGVPAVSKQRSRAMKMKFIPIALLFVLPFAASATGHARNYKSDALPPAYESGAEVMAPSWSAACMSDQGPRQCDEPMWVYGNPAAISRYGRAF
jgi:hypothetical protein